MNARSAPAALAVLRALAALPSAAEGSPLLPGSLRYEHGLGYREMAPDPEAPEEDDMEMEDYSRRHKLTLRLKEQWSDTLTTNLYTVAALKDSEDASESYGYFYLNPDLAWALSRRLKWGLSLRSKLTWLEPDASLGGPVDLLGLLAKTSLTWKAHERLKLVSSLQGAFDLYQDPARLGKTAQTYTAGLSLESKLADGLGLVGRYRGSFRYPLGPEATIDRLSNNELALAVSWDPNK